MTVKVKKRVNATLLDKADLALSHGHKHKELITFIHSSFQSENRAEIVGIFNVSVE